MMQRIALFAVLSLLVTSVVSCRSDEGLTEVREQQRQILAKLNALDQKIDKVAAARPAPPARQTGPDPARAYNLPAGNSPTTAPAHDVITITQFSPFQFSVYQCPYCAGSEPLVKQALQAYPEQARLVFKHFPLTTIHPQAMPAALAAAAAQKQGKFWEMHEKLFANQRALAAEQLKQYAGEI